MDIYTFTNEDVEFVEKAIKIKNRGLYINGAELTNAYNRILHKNVNVTNCGSCLRQRTQELENALRHFKEKMSLEATKQEDLTPVKEEENKEPEEPVKRSGGKKKK